MRRSLLSSLVHHIPQSHQTRVPFVFHFQMKLPTLINYMFTGYNSCTNYGINNTYTRQWSDPITLSSFLFSVTMIANCLWRYGYMIFVEGDSVGEVPVEMDILGFKIGRDTHPSRDSIVMTNPSLIYKMLIYTIFRRYKDGGAGVQTRWRSQSGV